MKKLWTYAEGNQSIEAFTAGDDPELDLVLIPYDIKGSLAHVRALRKIGILTTREESALVRELGNIQKKWEKGGVSISASDEDGHTVIENILTKKLGAVGKKIHTGRSRNDQVLTALRLYMKETLTEAEAKIESVIATLKRKARQYINVPMPGYTHMQRAMPSSVGLWLGSIEQALKDELALLRATKDIIDQNPLGSVVGYGETALGLDRHYTTKLLGFKKVQKNTLYASNSRGKFEYLALSSLQPIMLTLQKFATDALLFSTKEFGFLSLPPTFTTGSSAMPHKRNYDVLELIRARSSLFAGQIYTIGSIIGSLPSGYNRDYQLTKKPFIEGMKNVIETIEVAGQVMAHLTLDRMALKAACTPELYATDEAYALVKNGVPFRDAYMKVSQKYNKTN